MSGRFLVILEVSQKQSFIFKYKRLQNNVIASDVIRYVTNKVFFNTIPDINFSEEKNLVYDGGGHTILEFTTRNEAEHFISLVSRTVLEKFPEVELFATIHEYDDDITPEEGQENMAVTALNEEALIKKLEIKKSFRKASFHQGKFGIESSAKVNKDEAVLSKERDIVSDISDEKDNSGDYKVPYEFKDLGCVENENNFIAIVHIDGNLMGKRVKELEAKENWEEYKIQKREFSKNIDRDFKDAYKEMVEVVKSNMSNLLVKYKIEEKNGTKNGDNSKKGTDKPYLPVRKIITAGDDICFVTEGQIGIECARIFLQKLYAKTNETDNKNYSACAGVAIVHQKYPFYRAYEFAEQLCNSAKKYVATLSDDIEKNPANVCAIDWHIEYGEMMNGLSEVRKSYLSKDGNHLELRPYFVCGDESFINTDENRFRNYSNFRNLVTKYQGDGDVTARTKLKQFRGIIKESEAEATLQVNHMLLGDMLSESCDTFGLSALTEKPLFYPDHKKIKHSLVYDAIEIMDTFILLDDNDPTEDKK